MLRFYVYEADILGIFLSIKMDQLNLKGHGDYSLFNFLLWFIHRKLFLKNNIK